MRRLCERLWARHMLLSLWPSGPTFLHIYQVHLKRICPSSAEEAGKHHIWIVVSHLVQILLGCCCCCWVRMRHVALHRPINHITENTITDFKIS